MPKTSNFFASWLDYTENFPATKLFREWSAVFAISGALTRRVWLQTHPTFPFLYPNLFVLLVGEPGCGKNFVINPLRALWTDATVGADPRYAINVGVQSPTPKGLIDALIHDSAKLLLDYKGSRTPFRSIVLATPELGTILPKYDSHLLSFLCELYGCDPTLGEQVRNGKGEPLIIANPHAALIFGGTPSFVVSVFPEEAFGMGFFSRAILVFSEENFRTDLYPEENTHEALALRASAQWKSLVQEIRRLTHLAGPITVPQSVRNQINLFHKTECDKSALDYSRFKDYNTRRHLNAQKIAVCFCCSRSNDLTLTSEDWSRALDLLFRTEKLMPSIFQNTQSSHGFQSTIEEIIRSIPETGIIREQEIIRHIRKKHRPGEVMQILQSMINGGDLDVIGDSNGLRTFRLKRHVPTPQMKVVQK